MADGNNLGITYAESRGMNKIFTLMKPDDIETSQYAWRLSVSSGKEWTKVQLFEKLPAQSIVINVIILFMMMTHSVYRQDFENTFIRG